MKTLLFCCFVWGVIAGAAIGYALHWKRIAAENEKAYSACSDARDEIDQQYDACVMNYEICVQERK